MSKMFDIAFLQAYLMSKKFDIKSITPDTSPFP